MTVNISSPNTKNLRALQSDEALDALLGALQQRKAELQREHGPRVPVFVKIAPDLDEDQVRLIAATLKKERHRRRDRHQHHHRARRGEAP